MSKFFKKIFTHIKSQKGQSLVELLLAIGIASIIFPALLGSLIATRQGRAQQDQRTQAVALMREGQEAVRVVREKDWTTFAVDGTYNPVASGSSWILASGSATTNGFTTSIVVSDIYRNVQGNIAATGTLDPSTKQVVVTVSWSAPIATSVSSTAYYTRNSSLTFVDTLFSDFSSGTTSGTTVATSTGSGISGDGQVQLGSGGASDWCAPLLTINSLDMPGQGIVTAIAAVPGATSGSMNHAYATTGGNASGDSLDSLSITDPALPTPPASSNLDPYNNWKTYSVFADSSYAYLGSDHPGVTVDVVQVTSSPFTHVGYFSASGGGTGTSIYVVGNTGFVTAGSYLYSVNFSNHASPSEISRVALSSAGQRVIVNGNYAYVAESGTTNQLQIIIISNTSNMSVASSISMGNNLAGVDVSINNSATYAYVVTAYSSGKKDFFVIDINNRSIINSYSTNGMTPMGVATVTNNKVITVGSGGEQYQVIDTTGVSTINPPTHCGGLTNPNGATSVNAVAGIQEVDGEVYAYILTNNSSKEFQIIQGGPGGAVSISGTFDSRTFIASKEAAFNRMDATYTTNVTTDLKFQVAIQHAVNNSCTTGITYNYVGPDGTGSTYFSTTSAQIPFSTASAGFVNPGRCMKYRAFFSSTDQSQTPVLYDTTFYYSP